MRASGILLPIASLPSKYGIGTFSKSAYDFVDALKKAGQKYWQILPIGPTGYGDSPYQSFSTFAGNPYFIDPEALIKEGLLTQEECESYDFGSDSRYIDYEKIYLSRFDMLKRAYGRSNLSANQDFIEFQKENTFWLEDYVLYMAIKNHFQGVSFNQWPKDIKLFTGKSKEKYKNMLQSDVLFYEFIQYYFKKQWVTLKKYANENGIKIIGDIPIYVAYDSADTWSHPELFQLDEERNPFAVAGCPPDAFSAEGQLWGNPLYDWKSHQITEFEWWRQRIKYSLELYDVLRIDHFKGFDEYYSIPYGELSAKNGHWEKGPGIEFFDHIKNKLGDANIIAEDLGFITESLRNLLEKTGYPGMKVLQFAFDSREESDYMPHYYDKHCIVYTGTHDNDTILGWFDSINNADRNLVLRYMNIRRDYIKDINWDLIRLAMQSVANICIIPIQDYLGLGSEARMNTPSTVGLNWKWRLREGEINDDLLIKIRDMVKIVGRI
jgi:4-alpha-glucanotransferase